MTTEMSVEFLSSLSRAVDTGFEPVFVFPGQDVTESITQFKKNICIGDGLIQDGCAITSTMAGMLRYREPATYWVENNKSNYIPKTGDQVVGIIDDKGGDYYRVNIFSGSISLLSRLGFEGASKRNKPELKVGDVVYCKVTLAHKHLDTELTCISSSGVKKGWSSGEAIYGELPEGLTLRVLPLQAKMLLKPECPVLNVLGRHIAFEIAIGMNGLLWIQANSEEECIILRNAILNSMDLDEFQTEAMVEIMVDKLKLLRGRKHGHGT